MAGINPKKRPYSPSYCDDSVTASGGSPSSSDGMPPPFKIKSATQQRLPRKPLCYLLELPAELRELIWIHTVTEWKHPVLECVDFTTYTRVSVLHKKPIRMDRLNRPCPPGVTAVSHQIRHETLCLYYEQNIFECWRPLVFRDDRDWLSSTFGDWLFSLGQERAQWLRNVVLLYKHENELEYDIGLEQAGFEFLEGVITERRELSEYELCFESLGLPRHFGKRTVWDRWTAGSAI